MRKTLVPLLILALPLLGAGCSSNKAQSDAAAAKEWQKQPVPPAYLERAKAMSQGPMPMVKSPAAASGVPPATH